MALFFDAFLLALASSTDNFMVGLSIGISNKNLAFSVNALISVCNALGAWVASFGGNTLGRNLPAYMPPLLSAIAFACLGLRDWWELWQTKYRTQNLARKANENTNTNTNTNVHGEEGPGSSNGIINKTNGTDLNLARAVHLAIPMTLNNLAGGVAGGAIGVSPFQAGLYGLLASFLTMALGHLIGQYFARISNTDLGSRRKSRSRDEKSKQSYKLNRCRFLLDPLFASGTLLGILSFMSIQQAVSP